MSGGVDRSADGYRRGAVGGASVRADIVDVYVFRRGRPGPEFLQLLRSKPPLDGTWQPIMGHCEEGESAQACAERELMEEVGLSPGGRAMLGMWALEQVHPYFLAALNCVVMSPRFAVEVDGGWAARLNAEHSSHRWVAAGHAGRAFMWPGQRGAVREIVDEIVSGDSLSRDRLRVFPPPV